MGATSASASASSTALTDRPRSSCTRHTSPAAEIRMRLTTKPGTSAQAMASLRRSWAKTAATCMVSGAVSSPSTTSMRRIIEAG